MNAIIYAAGVSKRLSNYIPNGLKGLIKINKTYLIEYQLRWLTSLNIDNLIIVIGNEHEEYKKVLGNKYNGKKITYIYNNDYKSKGNMLSLWCARDYCNSDTIFTTSDLLCNLDDIEIFIKSNAKNKILIDSTNDKKLNDDDPVKVTIKNSKIIKIRKRIKELSSVDGISVGVYQFSREFMQNLISNIDDEISSGRDNQSLYYAIDNVINLSPTTPIFMKNCMWIDIDTKNELDQALSESSYYN
tara:strand:+ start:692 stop:1423 length:732 start_codon:yes stop_codon:yes gene_type:complete